MKISMYLFATIVDNRWRLSFPFIYETSFETVIIKDNRINNKLILLDLTNVIYARKHNNDFTHLLTCPIPYFPQAVTTFPST